MRSGGKVVWLTAAPETIYTRMSADPTNPDRRPNLTDRGPLDEIISLMERREPIYRESADLVVDTEGKNPVELVDEIIGRLDLSPDAE